MDKKIGLTFDIEEWFHVRNMRGHIPEDVWDKQKSRVELGTNYILEQLRRRGIKATFFILGIVADQNPALVREIVSEGHDIGSHGYNHKPIDLMTPDEFEQDLKRSIHLLEALAGLKIRSYRAPSFSITKQTWWALEILKRNGITCDSSIYPTVHPEYGISDFGREIKNIAGVIEVPMSTSSFLGNKVPISGGGYFRLYPYRLTKYLLKRCCAKHVVMYFHPWEFDADQPRVALPLLKKFRHYVGLNSNKKKFEALLDDFKFVTLKDMSKVSLTSQYSYGLEDESFVGDELPV